RRRPGAHAAPRGGLRRGRRGRPRAGRRSARLTTSGCTRTLLGVERCTMDSLRGKLLVAGPTLLDPNFRRTVVLICEHNEDGALGLVVNRATAVQASEAVPELADVLGDGARLWSGGPVQPQSIVLLADLDEPPQAA